MDLDLLLTLVCSFHMPNYSVVLLNENYNSGFKIRHKKNFKILCLVTQKESYLCCIISMNIIQLFFLEIVIILFFRNCRLFFSR